MGSWLTPWQPRQEQSGRRRPWHAFIHEAARLLGIHKSHLCDEIVAYAPSNRRRFAYSPTGVRDLIAKGHLSPLAKRLSQDRALVPFAFPREPASAAAFDACIKRLERENFQSIMVGPEGEVLSYVRRKDGQAESDSDDDVEEHVDDDAFSSYCSSD